MGKRYTTMVEQEFVKSVQLAKDLTAVDFTDEEIREVSHYIQANVKDIQLSQLLIFTDVPLDKSIVFIAVYRLLGSARSYITGDLHNKLNLLLDNVEQEYFEMYKLVSLYQGSTLSFGKHRLLTKIRNKFMDIERNKKINKFIDIFFMFGEKLQLYNLDKITGIDLESDSGKALYKDVQTALGTESAPKIEEDFSSTLENIDTESTLTENNENVEDKDLDEIKT